MINRRDLKAELGVIDYEVSVIKAAIRSALLKSLFVSEDIPSAIRLVTIDEGRNVNTDYCFAYSKDSFINYDRIEVASFPNRLLVDFLNDNCGENIDNTFMELIDDCVNVTYNEFLNSLEEYKE